MDLVVEAVTLATQLHRHQRKKKPIVPDIPYTHDLRNEVRVGSQPAENMSP